MGFYGTAFWLFLNVIHNLETHFERNTWTIYQVLPFCSSDVVEWCNSWLQSVFLTQNGGLLHGCKSSAWVGKSADLRQAYTEMVRRTRIINMTTQNTCKRKCNGCHIISRILSNILCVLMLFHNTSSRLCMRFVDIDAVVVVVVVFLDGKSNRRSTCVLPTHVSWIILVRLFPFKHFC